jgi:lysophospholipase L1-like esterase
MSIMTIVRLLTIGFASLLVLAPAAADEPRVKLITLGDSITRGERRGVTADETFAARLQAALRKDATGAQVVNVGIGGERTDQALKRLKTAVIDTKPAVVTIMYGTNDSYVDRDKEQPRLSAEQYRANLRQIIKELRQANITPVLMTPPRWGNAARNGKGENPNRLLETYVKVCREVAEETKTPLVDHFAHWTKQSEAGVDIAKWTTDGCHPNPEGHRILLETMLPVVREALKPKTKK